MPKKEIIKRLIEEIKDIDDSEVENYPLEYYEIRDLAKIRVILRASVRSHLFIYVLVNIFLILSNIFAEPSLVNYFYELWSLWVLVAWGLLLWGHAVIVWAIMTIGNIDKKVFAIISMILGYIGFMLIYVNYLVNYFTQSYQIWWPWVIGGIGLVIGSYAYIVYEISDDSKRMKKQVEKEINNIKKSMKPNHK